MRKGMVVEEFRALLYDVFGKRVLIGGVPLLEEEGVYG